MMTRAELEQNKIKQNTGNHHALPHCPSQIRSCSSSPAAAAGTKKATLWLGSRCHAAPGLLLAALTAG
jgi:hypothetical protein